VGENGGSVVEFNGDGLMAIFGAPQILPKKELAAVIAGQEIGPAVAELGFEVGIGIATGSAFVGSIRSHDRLIWTALGATTNLASRLEALTRDLEASLLVDDRTWRRAGPVVAHFQNHPGMRVRGFEELQVIHGLGS
jgi:class 3 adenylate cyclase